MRVFETQGKGNVFNTAKYFLKFICWIESISKNRDVARKKKKKNEREEQKLYSKIEYW